MAFMKWIIGGLLGAFIGGLIWVLIGYFAHAEVGIVAWGIGILVGVGVRFGAYLDDQEESELQGFVAGGLALAAVIAAKYLVFHLTVTMPISNVMDESFMDTPDEVVLLNGLSEELLDEYEEKGRKVEWLAGNSRENASSPTDYPDAIRAEAKKRLAKMPQEDRQKRIEEHQRILQELRTVLQDQMPGFTDTFSPYDALWIFLAVASAYRLGNGTNE